MRFSSLRNWFCAIAVAAVAAASSGVLPGAATSHHPFQTVKLGSIIIAA